MHLPRCAGSLPLFLAASSIALSHASSSSESKTTKTTTTSAPACTAYSHSNGAYYDLRGDIAKKPENGKSGRSGATDDYHVKGYDYGRNFTLNICGPVVTPVEDVVGLGKDDWKNVSAYYTYKGEVYSIGQQSLDLKSHGRVLVLQYTDGSPCGEAKSSHKIRRTEETISSEDHGAASYQAYESYLNEQERQKDASTASDDKDEGDHRLRRKSTTLSFHCDPEQIGGQAHFSYIKTDPDDCAYFFEVRSQHACARAEPHQPGSVGPGSVFAIILVIAVMVYFGGGVFYQRTVAHARGWRQLPNFTLWAGIWNVICDFFVIALSSCARLLPGRRGYRHLAGSPSRGRSREDENRLIDQLDEEWDD